MTTVHDDSAHNNWAHNNWAHNDSADVDRHLRRVIVLLFVNLGLSVLTTVLLFVFRDSITEYLIAHSPALHGERGRAAVRQAAAYQVWVRAATVVIVSLVYLLIAFKLRAGRRWAYRRVVWIAIAGSVGIAYLIIIGQYPPWMRVEQAAQGVVLLALLWTVTRPAVRARFARPVAVG